MGRVEFEDVNQTDPEEFEDKAVENVFLSVWGVTDSNAAWGEEERDQFFVMMAKFYDVHGIQRPRVKMQ